VKAVADASVLIGLSGIGLLSLLNDKFPTGVLVPPAVWREVVERGGSRPGVKEIAGARWVTVVEPKDREVVRLLRINLDEGEAEAIALAHEQHADAVLLDERDGRQTATEMGLPVLGTVGLLIWGKRTGKLAGSLREALDRLQERSRFRIGRTVYEAALRTVGE
jgi:predicted nucleic acid-binding protein